MPVKKVAHIKSGQRVYRVWGYPLKPLGSCVEDFDYHIFVEVCLPDGKRKHIGVNQAKATHVLHGSLCDRYFHKKERAEQFKREIIQGLHQKALEEIYSFPIDKIANQKAMETKLLNGCIDKNDADIFKEPILQGYSV